MFLKGRHKPSKHHGSANTLLYPKSKHFFFIFRTRLIDWSKIDGVLYKEELLVQVEEDSCIVQSVVLTESPESGQETREVGEGEDTSQVISITDATMDNPNPKRAYCPLKINKSFQKLMIG